MKLSNCSFILWIGGLCCTEKYMHKNRLQEFCAQTHKKLPIYKVELEGEYHQPKYKCTVEVDGKQFSSTGTFSRKKEAEQDAARLAYEILATIGEGDIKGVFGLLDQVYLLKLLPVVIVYHLFTS